MKRFCIFIVFLLSISQVTSTQDVYKTPHGAKYHLGTCRMVENVSEKVTIKQATVLGLTPCKICKPAIYGTSNLISNAQTTQAARGQGSTTQCRGKTKKGTRCRHMTSIANGYCFQHAPK